MKHFIAITLLLALFAAGCSDRILIKGTVSYEDDGLPVKHGIIHFDSAVGSFSSTFTNGNYKTGGEKKVQGIPPGQYTVWLSNVHDSTEEGGIVRRVSSEFCSRNSSPLTFEVKKGGPRRFDLKVTKPPE
ncbi:MAG: hypothetical protein LBT89_00275 [Planctomycetaceae bacterium]|jgi:hypothetical protein|nr:hypothetical protein [Planctomycetaceae bacterium]